MGTFAVQTNSGRRPNRRSQTNFIQPAMMLGLLAFSSGGGLLSSSQAALAAPADKQKPAKRILVRLSKDVTPSAYDLSVEPDLKKFVFAGTEVISLAVKKTVREILVNAAELDILQAKLSSDTDGGTSGAGLKEITTQIVPNAKSETVKFVLKQDLPPGNYKLHIKFNGILNDKLRGFYRSSFEDDKHVKHWLCTTQMEAIDARRMFPCFDEPEFKATFHIKTVIDPIYTAISNSAVEKEETVKGKKEVTFAVTPKMSSYLVALVVGELKASGEKVVGGVPVKVWAVAGKEHLGKYALEEAAKILAFETDYFKIPYPNSKLDLVAIPDFAAGAMENLGAIFYRDSLLLTDEKTGSIFKRERITSVEAHEMAHQWFGDLVTMRWWDDLWLNEAFASWMAAKTTDALHPEWRHMTQEISERAGTSTDALRSTRAIHAEVTDPGQMSEMFDDITYGKGAAVLRMLETFVGKNVFEDGVHKYLTDHSWSNATTEDLWQAIASCAPGVPVAQIMKTFVYQPGVPLVHVDSKDDDKAISAQQTRYFALGDDKNDKSLWLIPLVIRKLGQSPPPADDQKAERAGEQSDLKNAAAETDRTTSVLKKKEDTIELKGKWPVPVVNASGTGYYHTWYSPALLKKLQSGFKNLTADEKLILTSDVGALTLSRRVAIEDAYNFALNLPDEKDPIVQNDLVGYFYGPDLYMTGSARKAYEKVIYHYLEPLKQSLGWEEKPDESEADKSLRQNVLNLLGSFGQDKDTIKEASTLFDRYIKDHNAVGPNVIGTVFGIVAYNGGPAEYNKIMTLYKSAKNPEDRNRALYTLPSFRNNDLAQKTLAFALSKDVKLQDGLNILCSVAELKDTRAVGWPYIESHWSEIIHKFPEDHLRSLANAGSTVETRAQEAEVKKWITTHPIPEAQKTIAHMEENMNLRLLRRERFAAKIKQWTLDQAAKIQ